jgi:hypothetical protein
MDLNGGNSSGSMGLYAFWIADTGPIRISRRYRTVHSQDNDYVQRRKIGTIAVTDVDATWSTWSIGAPGLRSERWQSDCAILHHPTA